MGPLQLIGWAVFGLVAGAIARLLHPGRDPMNWLWTMLLGIGGAVIGGFAARSLGLNPDTGLMSWIAAIVGALVLLAVYHFATASRAAASSDYKKAVYD